MTKKEKTICIEKACKEISKEIKKHKRLLKKYDKKVAEAKKERLAKYNEMQKHIEKFKNDLCSELGIKTDTVELILETFNN